MHNKNEVPEFLVNTPPLLSHFARKLEANKHVQNIIINLLYYLSDVIFYPPLIIHIFKHVN